MMKTNSVSPTQFNLLESYQDKMDFLNAIREEIFGKPEEVVSNEVEKNNNAKYQYVYSIGTY